MYYCTRYLSCILHSLLTLYLQKITTDIKAKQENGYHKSIQLYSVIEEPSLSYPSYCVINVLLKAHPIFHLSCTVIDMSP